MVKTQTKRCNFWRCCLSLLNVDGEQENKNMRTHALKLDEH